MSTPYKHGPSVMRSFALALFLYLFALPSAGSGKGIFAGDYGNRQREISCTPTPRPPVRSGRPGADDFYHSYYPGRIYSDTNLYRPAAYLPETGTALTDYDPASNVPADGTVTGISGNTRYRLFTITDIPAGSGFVYRVFLDWKDGGGKLIRSDQARTYARPTKGRHWVTSFPVSPEGAASVTIRRETEGINVPIYTEGLALTKQA